MENQNSILILVPAKTARGGISNYYQVLKNEFSANIEYFERGARTWPVRSGFFSELARAFKDFNLFKKRIRDNDIALVQSTTSLGLHTTIRDGLFLRYAIKKGIKTIVFFRGWDESVVNSIQTKYLRLFKYFFFDCDLMIVLSDQAKATIINWGYPGEVTVETTLVDKNLIASVTREELVKKYEPAKTRQNLSLLFLSRIERDKGIFELLTAFTMLRQKISNKPNISLTICGDGSALEGIKSMVEEDEIKGVTIEGFVSGEMKKTAFENSHIFIFPSQHGEGMPNAVLEAMGFGLPVLTTAVGGLKDFFIDGKHGAYIQMNDANDIHEKLINLIENPEVLKEFSLNNHFLAIERFRSDVVAKRMERIFIEVIKR